MLVVESMRTLYVGRKFRTLDERVSSLSSTFCTRMFQNMIMLTGKNLLNIP